MTLADANHLAIRRLLSRSQALSHSTTTPGPPLPTSHPSPSLLAKLHLQIYTLYDESRSLCKTASRLSPDASGEVSDDLRKYLSQGRTVAQCLGWKWLGVDAGENGGREKAGMALAWLGAAKSGLEELSGGGSVGGRLKMIGKSGKKGKEKERKGKVGKELDSVNAFLSAYKKVNDTVRLSFLLFPFSFMGTDSYRIFSFTFSPYRRLPLSSLWFQLGAQLSTRNPSLHLNQLSNLVNRELQYYHPTWILKG